MKIREWQERILDLRPLSPRVREAFLTVPRHKFVGRFREPGSRDWTELSEKNLSKFAGVIYRDAPLAIWGEFEDFQSDTPGPVSTISQPSFVLFQLDLLDVQPGHDVFELGTGSGWNAALLGFLARPGRVRTYEIIRPLAESARERIQSAGLENVEVIAGDGIAGGRGAYDRAIFTAGAYDIPPSLHQSVKEGGRLLFVMQHHAGADLLIVFAKTAAGFESERILECGFVGVTGEGEGREYQPHSLDSLTRGEEGKPVQLAGELMLLHLDSLVEFLSLHPQFVPLKRRGGRFAWKVSDSVLIVDGHGLTVYGDEGAVKDLGENIEKWRDWDRPSLHNFSVLAVPRGTVPSYPEKCVVMPRNHTTFIWRLI